MVRWRVRWAGGLAVLLLLAACGAMPAPTVVTDDRPPAPVQLRTATLATPTACSAGFVPHALEHTTRSGARIAAVYESNGAGVALGDLDGDGRDEVVLANLAGDASLLWNRGALRFARQALPVTQARAVAVVDVDADGRSDLVFTRRFEKPLWLRNTGVPGAARFSAQPLPDVNNTFYSMAWADLDDDGDLDLVAASYDAEQLKHQGQIFTQRGGIGVFVYWREGATFRAERLATAAEALAIALIDLDGDGQRDIWIGNDFNVRDQIWLRVGSGWRAGLPLDSMTENTMSLDWGDIDNDGQFEIFASDMKPVDKDVATMARWLPMMKKMTRPLTSDDPQHAENTLQVRGADGRWRDQAYERRVDSSGWSWSAKFGDLDADGALDLLVVNGMIARGLFDHLPGAELVEPNMAFRNRGAGSFAVAHEWRLGATASGRGMSMGDLDGDGDLDVVVNNLEAPAVVFENQICGAQHLTVAPRMPGSANPLAVGARLTLRLADTTLVREVRAISGYLSGDPAAVHFGLPPGAVIDTLRIDWPDGRVSWLHDLTPGQHLQISATS